MQGLFGFLSFKHVLYRYFIVIHLIQLLNTSLMYGQGARIYVNQQSTGNDTGESWEDAFVDLQDALGIAQYGDTIWVAQGIYKPSSSTDRTIFFELKNGVALLGGFVGDEQRLEERNLEVAETILSGDVGAIGDSLDNSYHVVYTLGTDSSTILDGFTITGGVANIMDPSFSSTFLLGGGMLVDTNEEHPKANLRIQYCRFVNNTALRGGGLYILSAKNTTANPAISNCQFEDNRAILNGGGMAKSGDFIGSPICRVENCQFLNNMAGDAGGGCYLFGHYLNLQMDSCLFWHNKARDLGGGIGSNHGEAPGHIRLNACQFIENEGSSGGALQMTVFAPEFGDGRDFVFELEHCSFLQNRALNDKGGAIGNLVSGAKSSLYIRNCLFSKNWSFNRGGAVQLQGTNVGENNLILERSYFAENVSATGISGGVRAGASNEKFTGKIEVFNCTFWENTGALTFLNNKGVIHAKVYNNTFIHNGTLGPTIVKRWSPDFVPNVHWVEAEIVNCIFSEIPDRPLWFILNNNTLEEPSLYGFNIHHNLINASACNLPGGEGACGAGNLFNINPQFRDSLNGDFRLAGCSPAINAGVNSGLIGEFDLDGNPRVLEGRVDMGAYEQETFDLTISTIEASEVSCFGEGDGEVRVTTNGEGPLSYNWTQNGTVGRGNTDLTPGLYAMTVTDQQNCEENLFVQIDEPDSLMASFTAIPATSGQSDGYITLDEIAGGRQPYQWDWSNGATTPSVDGLSNGIYQVSLTDGNGCIKSWSFLLEALDANVEPSEKARFTISPNPLSNGQALLLSYQLENSQKCQVKLLDLLGQEQQSSLVFLGEKGEIAWPVKPLPQGTYLLLVWGENGTLLAAKPMVYE